MATTKELLVNLINDKLAIDMINQYHTMSYLEAIGDSRSETAHSSFIRTLIKYDESFLNKNESPLMKLLLAIVLSDNSNRIPTLLSQQILSGNLKYKIKEVSCEKPVCTVAKQYFATYYPKGTATDDRLDIYIACEIQDISGKTNDFEIIIENKIHSSEEGPKNKVVLNGYDNLWQTERYYNACQNLNRQQIFVYLTPSDYPDCRDKHFIHLTYQCLLDNMFIPLLESKAISNHLKFMLDDYIKALDIPTPDMDGNKRSILARRKTDIENLNMLIHSNEELSWQFVKAQVKEDNSMQLTSDEQVLLSYIKGHIDFFKMLSDYTDKDIDINGMRMKVDEEWIVSFTKTRTFLFKKSWLRASQGQSLNPIAYIKIPNTAKLINCIPTKFFIEVTDGVGNAVTQGLSSKLLGILGKPVSNNSSSGNAHYYQYSTITSNPVASNTLKQNLKDIIQDNGIRKHIANISSILG